MLRPAQSLSPLKFCSKESRQLLAHRRLLDGVRVSVATDLTGDLLGPIEKLDGAVPLGVARRHGGADVAQLLRVPGLAEVRPRGAHDESVRIPRSQRAGEGEVRIAKDGSRVAEGEVVLAEVDDHH